MTALGAYVMVVGTRASGERVRVRTCASGTVSEWKRVRVGTCASGKCTDNTAANAANYAAANIIGALRCRKRLQEGSHIRTKKHSAKRCATKRHVRHKIRTHAPQNATFALTIWP